MKKVLSFTVERPRNRAHRVLFLDDTPFKPKVVRPKNRYKRKQKHPGKLDNYPEI